MRSFMMSTVVAVAVMAVAGSVSADQAKLVARPRIEVAPPVRISYFGRQFMQTTPYTGGALGLGVEVENTGNTSADNVSVKLTIDGQTMEQSVSVGPNGKRQAIFWDQAGVPSCTTKLYKMSITAPGAATITRESRMTPSCTFTSNIEQTWNKMSPDVVAAQKAGNAYLTNASVLTAPACGKNPTLKVRVVNNSSSSSASLIVQAKEFTAAAPVVAQTSAAFPLALNEQKDVTLSPLSAAGTNAEPAAKMKLAIHDWSKSLGGHTSDGGIIVNNARSCSLAFAFE